MEFVTFAAERPLASEQRKKADFNTLPSFNLDPSVWNGTDGLAHNETSGIREACLLVQKWKKRGIRRMLSS